MAVRTHREVVSIDRSSQTVKVCHVESGETEEQGYDRLVLATGSSPIVSQIEGVDAWDVFTLRNLEDTDRVTGSDITGGGWRPAPGTIEGSSVKSVNLRSYVQLTYST